MIPPIANSVLMELQKLFLSNCVQTEPSRPQFEWSIRKKIIQSWFQLPKYWKISHVFLCKEPLIQKHTFEFQPSFRISHLFQWLGTLAVIAAFVTSFAFAFTQFGTYNFKGIRSYCSLMLSKWIILPFAFHQQNSIDCSVNCVAFAPFHFGTLLSKVWLKLFILPCEKNERFIVGLSKHFQAHSSTQIAAINNIIV